MQKLPKFVTEGLLTYKNVQEIEKDAHALLNASNPSVLFNPTTEEVALVYTVDWQAVVVIEFTSSEINAILEKHVGKRLVDILTAQLQQFLKTHKDIKGKEQIRATFMTYLLTPFPVSNEGLEIPPGFVKKFKKVASNQKKSTVNFLSSEQKKERIDLLVKDFFSSQNKSSGGVGFFGPMPGSIEPNKPPGLESSPFFNFSDLVKTPPSKFDNLDLGAPVVSLTSSDGTSLNFKPTAPPGFKIVSLEEFIKQNSGFKPKYLQSETSSSGNIFYGFSTYGEKEIKEAKRYFTQLSKALKIAAEQNGLPVPPLPATMMGDVALMGFLRKNANKKKFFIPDFAWNPQGEAGFLFYNQNIPMEDFAQWVVRNSDATFVLPILIGAHFVLVIIEKQKLKEGHINFCCYYSNPKNKAKEKGPLDELVIQKLREFLEETFVQFLNELKPNTDYQSPGNTGTLNATIVNQLLLLKNKTHATIENISTDYQFPPDDVSCGFIAAGTLVDSVFPMEKPPKYLSQKEIIKKIAYMRVRTLGDTWEEKIKQLVKQYIQFIADVFWAQKSLQKIIINMAPIIKKLMVLIGEIEAGINEEKKADLIKFLNQYMELFTGLGLDIILETLQHIVPEEQQAYLSKDIKDYKEKIYPILFAIVTLADILQSLNESKTQQVMPPADTIASQLAQKLDNVITIKLWAKLIDYLLEPSFKAATLSFGPQAYLVVNEGPQSKKAKCNPKVRTDFFKSENLDVSSNLEFPDRQLSEKESKPSSNERNANPKGLGSSSPG